MYLVSHLTPVRALKIKMAFGHCCERWAKHFILANYDCFTQLVAYLVRDLGFEVEAFKFARCATADEAFVPQNSFFINEVVQCLCSFTLFKRTKTPYTAVKKPFYWLCLEICLFDSFKHRFFIPLKIVDPFFYHHWHLACLLGTNQKIGAPFVFKIDSCRLVATS